MPSQKHSETEFVAMVQENERLIYKVCSVYAQTPEDRRDLFQEIVLQAWRGYARYTATAKISTWLYRVALNTAISHKRKQGRSVNVSGNDELLHQLEDSAADNYAEEYKALYTMIAELPAFDKALVLLYLEDKSYQEIAEILGITASNVGAKLSRIKEKMRRQATTMI